MLAIEYALKYQQHLKGLVISNMMSSIPQYNEYAQKVLMPAMDQKVLAEIKQLEAAGKYEDPRYMELLIPQPLRAAPAAHAARAVAGSGEPRVQAHQPEDLRADAGPERARRERQARRTGIAPPT